MLIPLAARTDAAREAERLVRDPALFKWYAVALLAFVFYVYAVEVERRRWDVVAAGLAVWVADWFNEIVNALVLHATDEAPLWARPARRPTSSWSASTSRSRSCLPSPASSL
jgi:hypothetical protein